MSEDGGTPEGDGSENQPGSGSQTPARALPADLPKSLNDPVKPQLVQSTTTYMDPWTGEERTDDIMVPAGTDTFAEDLDEVDHILRDPMASDMTRRQQLQQLFTRACSNGNMNLINKVLQGPAIGYVDLNKQDDDGTTPLIYATCFGHQQAVRALLTAGANVGAQDKNKWTALIWATNNNHADIVKDLIEFGASKTLRSSSGRTAVEFAAPGSQDIIKKYLASDNTIGRAGFTNDDGWYDRGLPDSFLEEQMAEEEVNRRMMMESAYNLEVDLGALGLDDNTNETEYPFPEDETENWQFFVFTEADIPTMMQVLVREMQPMRSNAQKPVPANVIFLSMRYAHLYGGGELMVQLSESFFDQIEDLCKQKAEDMTVLAFWISNCTLLLYYLLKDGQILMDNRYLRTRLEDLVEELYINLLRDAERRIEKQIDKSILRFQQIEGLSDVKYENDWRILFRRNKRKEVNSSTRPPSPRARAEPSPRTVTSLLSSTLYVLEAYDIHETIIIQLFSQLYYWLSAELFNKILRNKKYLSRSQAMEIRLNFSAVEDWAIVNNRSISEESKSQSGTLQIPSILDSARKHIGPLVQLLQWLQCLSCLSNDIDTTKATIQALNQLTPSQLLKAAKDYRQEVGEQKVSKDLIRYLQDWQRTEAAKNNPKPSNVKPDGTYLDAEVLLPLKLPSQVDMAISYGSGVGGMNREKERRFTPFVPIDIIDRLDMNKDTKGNRRTLPSEYFESDRQGRDAPTEESDADNMLRSNW